MSSTTIDRIRGINSGIAIKAPCRVATTANITLSGEQTIDGVAVVADDRVLVKNQTTASQNGIYTASTSTWSRAADFDGSRDVVTGTLVSITAGTTNADTFWTVTTTGTITPGTTSITFAQRQGDLGNTSAFIDTLLDDTDAATARATLDAAQLASSLSTATPVPADSVSFIDASASNAEKKTTLSALIPALAVSIPSAKTTSYTAALTDHCGLILCDTTSGAFSVTLPEGSTLVNGFRIGIRKNAGSATLTIARSGSDKFYWPANETAGYTSIKLPTIGDTIWLVNNGSTAWYVESEHIAGPYFSAYQNAAQSVNNATFTKVTFDTEVTDTHANYDPSTNYRFTPEVPGYYHVRGHIGFSAVADGKVIIGSVYKNGSGIAQLTFHTGVAGNEETGFSDRIISMNGTTDYLEFYCYHTHGSAVNTTGGSTKTNFEAIRLR